MPLSFTIGGKTYTQASGGQTQTQVTNAPAPTSTTSSAAGVALPPRNDAVGAGYDSIVAGNPSSLNNTVPSYAGMSSAQILSQPFALAGGQQFSGIDPASAPENVSGINSINPVSAPATSTLTPGINGVGGLVSYYQSQFTTAQQQADDLAKKEAVAQATQNQTKGALSSLLGTDAAGNARIQAQNATGIDPTQYFADEKARIAEIDTLSQQYNAAVASRDQQIAQTNDKMASTNFISNQIAQINRNAAPVLNQMSADINSRSAALQASQGMFAEAQTYVQQAVAAATAQQKSQVDGLTTIYNMNQDTINQLDSKYKDALQTARDASSKIYQQQLSDKTAVGDLLLKYPKSGINIATDTLQQAQTKAAQYEASVPTKSTLDTQVVEVNGNKVLINSQTGQTIQNLGKATSANLTGPEKVSQAISQFSSAFVPGAKLPDGTPLIDQNGFITPVAWKQAIADAPAEGLTRQEFIKEFGSQLYSDNGKVSSSYGLTPAEIKIINGALPQ